MRLLKHQVKNIFPDVIYCKTLGVITRSSIGGSLLSGLASFRIHDFEVKYITESENTALEETSA